MVCMRYGRVDPRPHRPMSDELVTRRTRLQALRPPRIRRKNRRREVDTLRTLPDAVAHPRAAYRDRTDAGHDLALGQTAVTHQASTAIIGDLVSAPLPQRCHLGFHRLRQKRSCAVAQDLGQWIGKSPWLGELQNVSVGRGVSSFDGEWRPRTTPPRYATASLHAVTNFQA